MFVCFVCLFYCGLVNSRNILIDQTLLVVHNQYYLPRGTCDGLKGLYACDVKSWNSVIHRLFVYLCEQERLHLSNKG